MSFELKQLREAAEKYTYHDAGTHGVWPRLVWERRTKSPLARLDDAVEFLGKWKALRFKGGRIAFRRICTTWLRKSERAMASWSWVPPSRLQVDFLLKVTGMSSI